jgi:hypothetical protein
VRVLIAMATLCSLYGCAFLNDSLNHGPKVDPNRIYLGRSEVFGVQREDIARYGCLGRPMVCVQHGVNYSCRCP